MDSKQLFGLFIVVIMVGSIFGFAVLFSGKQGKEQAQDFEVNSGLPDSTVIKMNAENINAKVVEVLPKVLFSAYTNEAEIVLIDKKLALVEGIYTIDSKYRQVEESSFGTSLAYIAEISFDKDKSVEEISSAINDATKDVLFDPVYFQVVLISVPTNIKFSNEQGFDLNYEYEDPITVAYVLPGTFKGDDLNVRIDASFTGNTMVSSFASVLNNLTSEPKIHLFELTKPIEEKLPRIVFGAFVGYSDYLEEELLKEKIRSLSNVLDANVVSFKPENYFTVFFESETDLKEEFNQFLQDNNESLVSIEVFEEQDGFSAKVYFSEGNALESENLVAGFLEDRNVSNISVVESTSKIFASISLFSADSVQTVLELNGLLTELNFTESQIQQEVVVSFDSFVSEEGKEFFPDENTIVEVFVPPEKSVGEEVDLKIEVTTARDSVISIRAASE